MIIVTGSLAFDFIMDFPGKFADQIVPEKIHQINLSFLVNTLRQGNGGTAGNIAYNLALLKQRVGILASAGKDFTPYKLFLKKNKVETKFINIRKDDFTARAFITTDLSDNQITGFYPGAINYDKDLSLSKVKPKPELVVISPTDPIAMGNFVSECIEEVIPFMFDPGMQLPRLSDEILKRGSANAKILIGNDYEISLLKNKLNIRKWNFQKKDQIIITTLGKEGSIIETAEKKISIPPAKPKEVLDPTGAGDAYRGGFLAGYLRKLPFEVCGRMGSLASIYTVEKYGTSTHKYSVAEFCGRYEKNFKEKLKII